MVGRDVNRLRVPFGNRRARRASATPAGADHPDRAPVRWGIAGPGAIAKRFVRGLSMAGGGTVTAVASRQPERAGAFCSEFDLEARCCSYEELAHSDVDIVYVATPHSGHAEDTVRALSAGKHVLCEKPLALDATQVREMVDAARINDVFLMEAIWSRFVPAYLALRAVLDSGRIGEPRMVESSFGFRAPVDPAHRLFDPARGGGALLDLGIYPLQLATYVLGPVEEASAVGVIGATGVDEQVAAVLQHLGGGIGIVQAALRTTLPNTARISGTDGWVELPAFMHCPTSLTVGSAAGSVEVIDASFEGDGLQFEITEVHRCLREGRRDSPIVPLDESIALAETMDSIRAQIGLRYPHESAPG